MWRHNPRRPGPLVILWGYANSGYLSMVEPLGSATPSLETIVVVGDVKARSGIVAFNDLLDGAPKKDYPAGALRAHRPNPDDLSLVGFTSGTTAMPKAYLHTHNTEYANSFNCLLADSYRYLKKPPSVNACLFASG